MAELDDEGFGEFEFAPKKQFNFNQINVINTNVNGRAGDDDDDDWGDFVATPHQRPTPGTSPQFSLSNGISYQHQSPLAPSTNYDPLGFFNNGSVHSSGDSSKVGNPSRLDSQKLDKPRGPLPLSLFGLEEEDQKEGSELVTELSPTTNYANAGIHLKATQMVKNGFTLNSDAGINDTITGLYSQNQQIKVEYGSNLKGDPDFSGDNEGSDYDEDWEFKGAVPENGGKERNSKGGSAYDLFGSKMQTVSMIDQEKKAGQEAPSTVENNPALHGSVNGFAVPFSASNRVPELSGIMDFALDFKSSTVTSDSLTSHPLSQNEAGNGNEIASTSLDENDDYDEFGDFVDASSESGSKSQGQHKGAQMGASEAQLSDGKIQVGGDERENLRGALPLSIFSDGAVGSEGSHEDLLIHKPAVNPTNSVNRHDSKISIQDLISNLYSEAQPAQAISSVNSLKKTTDHGWPSTPKLSALSSVNGNDGLDKSSWEFTDALTETKSRGYSVELAHTLSKKPSEMQNFLDFYSKLRDNLCLTVSSLLDDIKTCTFTGKGEKVEMDNNEIQEAHNILQDSLPSCINENYAEKQYSSDNGIEQFLKILSDPIFQALDSEYLLSSRLPLAEKDWRIAVQLLRHATYTVRILAMASGVEQSSYVSTWSKILFVCTQELKHGTSLWKKALETGVQGQILSDIQGQQKILALGEVYRVVELIGATSKLYKPWILNMVDHMNIFTFLDECSSLWSSSGLLEALQHVSDVSEFGQSVMGLIDALNNIRDIDLNTMHDATFKRQSTICRLSLLPHELFQDLKMVTWNDESYLLNFANLWANLISCDPPKLPQLRLG